MRAARAGAVASRQPSIRAAAGASSRPRRQGSQPEPPWRWWRSKAGLRAERGAEALVAALVLGEPGEDEGVVFIILGRAVGLEGQIAVHAERYQRRDDVGGTGGRETIQPVGIDQIQERRGGHQMRFGDQGPRIVVEVRGDCGDRHRAPRAIALVGALARRAGQQIGVVIDQVPVLGSGQTRCQMARFGRCRSRDRSAGCRPAAGRCGFAQSTAARGVVGGFAQGEPVGGEAGVGTIASLMPASSARASAIVELVADASGAVVRAASFRTAASAAGSSSSEPSAAASAATRGRPCAARRAYRALRR